MAITHDLEGDRPPDPDGPPTAADPIKVKQRGTRTALVMSLIALVIVVGAILYLVVLD